SEKPARAGHPRPLLPVNQDKPLGLSSSQDRMMSRQDANAAFALTSFLYGGNAAYIEDLHARYEADPASVDAEWQAFFSSLKDSGADVTRSARGASWKQRNWPAPERGELISALDGDWREVEKPVGDKIKAKAQASG